ncbi:MAG: hypothetical protein IJO72_02475 [Oscillospiraceae bacterium]|nr:hypothetical protein [Oscillospiraceae bacterium]
MDLFDIITLSISAISLLGLIYQSINLKQTINSQIYQNFVANSLEIDRILIDKPELRKYVYYGEPIDENTENLDQILSFIELVIDISENIEVYKKYIPKSRREGWFAFVNDTKKTPAYKFYMEKHQSWYKET